MNGLNDYWRVIKKRLPMILLISVAVAVLALVIARQVETTHEVHFSYVVSLQEREPADEYRFDGYYALQATDLFSATLAQWLAAPETVVAAYHAAGLPLPGEDPRTLTRLVRAEKAAPQLVTVTVKGSNKDSAERLARGIQEVMKKNIAAYHASGAPVAAFAAVATESWTGAVKVSTPIVVTATFVFAFLILLNGTLLVESLRSESSEASKSKQKEKA